jgi:hypothetical protein
MGILDPNDFTIAPGDMRSLQDRMLELRRGLPPSLQGPQVGGQPQQTQPEQTNQGLGDQINRAAQMLAQQTVQQQSQATGEKPKRKDVQAQLDEYQGLLDQMNPMKPKQSIGSGAIGSMLYGEDKGGLFGTGIQPVDVLAFALGAAITSHMPQDKAIATTMSFAKMPGEFRDYQDKRAQEFIQNKLSGINAEISTSNAEVAQANAAQAKQKFGALSSLANAFRVAGQESKALALEAGAVNDYEKLTGDTSKAPTSLMQHIEGIASGSVPPPPWFMQMTGAKSPREAQAAASAWFDAHLMNQPLTPMPAGGALQKTLQGPQIVNEAPVMGQTRGILDIRRDLEMQRRGGVVQPQAAPMATQAPIAGEPIRRLEPTPSGGFMPPQPAAPAQPAGPVGLPVGQLLSSRNPQDNWTGRFTGDMLPQTQQSVGALFQKPLDASVRQKLVAQKAAIEYSEDLLNKYNAMVTSYGGEGQFKFTDQMKQWMVTQGSRISGEGLSGALLSTAADLARRGAQEFGRPFTAEAHDFMAMYNQAQKFARGAMNDAANLATRERDMFAGMLGKPLDKPAFFRATLKSFHDEIAREYNDNLAANKLNKMEGLNPIEPLRGLKPPPKWFRPLNQEQAPTQSGGEY